MAEPAVEGQVKRRKTRQVWIGNVPVGGGSPISVQSMTKTRTEDVEATVSEVMSLEREGCDIVRVAVPTRRSVDALAEIKRSVHIPVVADIHFDYRLAIGAIRAGADGVRINPGNLALKHLKAVADAARERPTPIRVGLNSGSLPRYSPGRDVAGVMVSSALKYVRALERVPFHAIVVSLKASDVVTTVRAYEKMAPLCDVPFHLGVTAAGPGRSGVVSSAVGIGSLLLRGIGDTIRVSLTGDPVEEVKVGHGILDSLGLGRLPVRIVSCPTCGRCQIDLRNIVSKVEKELLSRHGSRDGARPITVAIMGCVVNGPGEAREADVGLAAGKGVGMVFRRGRPVCRVPEREMARELIREVDKMLRRGRTA